MNFLLQYMDYLVVGLAATIVLGSYWIFRSWVGSIRQAQTDLDQIASVLIASPDSARATFTKITRETESPRLKHLLEETRAGFIDLPGDLGPKTYSLRSYGDIWNVKTAISDRVNLSLFESMPNLLIGFGLMCTFVFLTLALFSATSGLAGGGDSQKALEHLLESAAGKFVTSIAGLLCSLVWNWNGKKVLTGVENTLETVRAAIRGVVPDNASEAAIAAQLGLFSEMLKEEREQVGQLRRFETDFAVAIAKAQQPAFDALANDLGKAIRDLSDRMGSMNEESLNTMMQEFSQNLRNATSEEMGELKRTLSDLATSLADSGKQLSTDVQEAGGKAAGELKQAGESISNTFGEASASFKDAASILESAIISTKATVNDLDEVLTRSVEVGRGGADAINVIVNKLQSTVSGLSNAATDMAQLVSSIEKSVGGMQSVSDNLDDTVEAQRSLVVTLRDLTPQIQSGFKDALNSIGSVADAIDAALKSTASSLKASGDLLDNTVTSLNSGVKTYTEQVAALHVRLDQEMTKAVTKLGGSITALEDTLDEFSEAINEKK